MASALVMSACGSDDDDAADGNTESTEPASTEPESTEPESTESSEPATDEICGGTPGGTLTVAVPSLSSTLDPLSASGGLGGDLIHVYDVLMSYDASTGEFTPRLAESVTSNDDATVWTIVLRDDVTFGNGDPLTAESVKASMDRHLMEGSTTVLRAYAPLIGEITVVDDLTLEASLNGPWGAFPFALTRGLGYITNSAVIDEVGVEAFATDPTGGGAGPFEVTDFAPPERIVFTAKDDWWGGEVCLDEVVYEVIPDANAANEAFINGEIDVSLVDARSPIASAEAKAMTDNVSTMIQHGGGIVLMNSGRGEEVAITSDPRVRAAVAAAIDTEALNERVFEGAAVAQSSLVADASEVYEPLEGPAYDPEQATALLEEVKAETGWDGTLRFDCVSNLADAALTMAAMLDAVGFQVELEPNRSLPQQIGLVVDGNFDLACFGHTPDEADMWDGLRPYQSTNPGNLSGTNSPELDAALEELRSATTTDEVQEKLGAVQAVWNEVVPAAVYAAFEHVLVWDDDVNGIEFNDSVTVVPMLEHAYISPG